MVFCVRFVLFGFVNVPVMTLIMHLSYFCLCRMFRKGVKFMAYKKMMNMRKHESKFHSKKKFYSSSKPHPMNRVYSFVSGHGIFRGGVTA